MKNALVWLFALLGTLASAPPALAQVQEHALRIGIDADVFSAGVVRENPRGPAPPRETTVIGVGPNLMGSSRAVIATPTVGIGVAYALAPKWMLGARTGFGFDKVSPERASDQKVLAISFMPELTFVPIGKSAPLFLRFSPVAQFNQVKQGSVRRHIFMGCFSFGAGTFLFTSRWSSVDLGAYFEGRFGKLKPQLTGGSYVDVNDLRGVARLGISLWR